VELYLKTGIKGVNAGMRKTSTGICGKEVTQSIVVDNKPFCFYSKTSSKGLGREGRKSLPFIASP